MTDILLKCLHCSKHLAVDHSASGKVLNCVDCGQPVQVPFLATAFNFKCPSCSCDLSAPPSLAGERFNCPNCDGDVSVQESPRASQSVGRLASDSRPRITASNVDDQVRRCPTCGKSLLSRDTVICVACGRDLRTGKPLPSIPPALDARKRNSPSTYDPKLGW